MTKPYALLSDQHLHPWSAFSTTLSTGVNSRLQMLLDEFRRAANELKELGGDTLVYAGDLFHVRGSVAPSVLNPTIDLHKKLIAEGFRIVMIPGNHDLEGKNTHRIGNAVTALETVGCEVIHSDEDGMSRLDEAVLVPWHESIEELKFAIENTPKSERKGRDLIIHAPVDGVIMNLPNHGLTADYLGGLGFRYVFSGHYHNHKDFGNDVFSIGALAHHTWSDVGSKAGFLIVGDKVNYRAAHTPQFLEIGPETDPEEIPLIVQNNYVKVRINSSKHSDIQAMREFLTRHGALGVVVQSMPEAKVVARTGSAVKSGSTIEASVSDFVGAAGYKHQEAVLRRSLDVLNKVRAVEV